MNHKIVITASVIILLAIVLGAFGAHGLKSIVSESAVTSFNVGVRYQMYVGLTLLILGLESSKFSFNLKPVFALMLIGISFFSLSIYGLSLREYLGINLSFLGPITPLGGLLMIISWTVLIVKLLKNKSDLA